MIIYVERTSKNKRKKIHIERYVIIKNIKKEERKRQSNSPSRSSPKLPDPIFLPTRKLGPTMSTLEEEVTLYLEEYALNLVALPLPREILLVVSCSRSELRASCSCVSLPSLFCMVRVSSVVAE